MIAKEDVRSAVCSAIARTFDFPLAEIHRHTCALDVPGWDSVSNATVILEIEELLGVELPVQEIMTADNVSCMVDIIFANMNREA